jgi:hypothetical protein
MRISGVRESFADENRDRLNHQKRDGQKRIPVQRRKHARLALYRDPRLRLHVRDARTIGLMDVGAWCDP